MEPWIPFFDFAGCLENAQSAEKIVWVFWFNAEIPFQRAQEHQNRFWAFKNCNFRPVAPRSLNSRRPAVKKNHVALTEPSPTPREYRPIFWWLGCKLIALGSSLFPSFPLFPPPHLHALIARPGRWRFVYVQARGAERRRRRSAWLQVTWPNMNGRESWARGRYK